jgi:hypothetical protein
MTGQLRASPYLSSIDGIIHLLRVGDNGPEAGRMGKIK